MILNKYNSNGVDIYVIKKRTIPNVIGTEIKRSQIPVIINSNADVYTDEGKLLLRFRKKVLPETEKNAFYDNIIKFASLRTSNRGACSGSQKKTLLDNERIQSNIFGYFDSIAVKQKYKLKQQNIQLHLPIRQCRFNRDYPDKYEKTIPLIKSIDKWYCKLIPDKYKLQRKKADDIYFKIEDTSFTTITTNINFQTRAHTDKGDDPEGFGNLTVIQKGNYRGGETCFPEYGIGVNVRTGDVLFMDVHEVHCNLPIELIEKDAIRLSVVCYLRRNIWEKTKDISYQDAVEQMNLLNTYL
jgi:hypothetical protein